MIVGMIPMAIGGAGEEQNAVLARAVIGGLLGATLRGKLPGCVAGAPVEAGQRHRLQAADRHAQPEPPASMAPKTRSVTSMSRVP